MALMSRWKSLYSIVVKLSHVCHSLSSYINSSWKSSQSFRKKNIRIMTDTKITIVCREGEDHITDISLTAERNYTPIFTEAFSTQEKPLNVHLIREKDIFSENAAKSGAEQILSNLTELIRNSLEIAGIEFDWNRFHNRREFKEYFWKLINE